MHGGFFVCAFGGGSRFGLYFGEVVLMCGCFDG